MIKPKSSFTIEKLKLSVLLGEMEFRKCGVPYENPQTKEITTKITVISDLVDDMFEITCSGEIPNERFTRKQKIDFEDCVVKFTATGTKGFNTGEHSGIIGINIRAGKILDFKTTNK